MPYLDIELTRTSFDQELSDEYKAHLLAFAEKYRPKTDRNPADMPLLSKIRRRGLSGVYKTDKVRFTTYYSFFIENDKQHPHRCRLHFIDHWKHAEGRFGRVLFIFAMLELDFDKQTIFVHKDPKGMPLARIKGPKKNRSFDLLHEFMAMPKYSPFDQGLNEKPYELFDVENSKKQRFFMPDLGNTLKKLFISNALNKLPPAYRLLFGRDQLSLAEQLCRAVAKLHADGYVHRDIKPDNILMKPTGTGLLARLADYGFHCHKYEVIDSRGAPLYCPGEISEHIKRRHFPSMDVYALCLTLIQWLFLDFKTVTMDNFTHHLKRYTTLGSFQAQGYHIHEPKIVPEDPVLLPLIDLLYQGFKENPAERPSAEQLADCIGDITKKLDHHSRLYTINLNKFNGDISEKFKEHFLAFIATYRSVKKDNDHLPDLVKIRRQEPHGTYKTRGILFKIEHSFYIETLDNPDSCRLYFIDHTQHIDGFNSRVGRCTLIVNADLKEKTLLVNKRTESNLPLRLMKCGNKHISKKVVNQFLRHEFQLMPKYNPSNPDFLEEKYSLYTVNASAKKLRFFMPDKGLSLDQLCLLKGWDKLSAKGRILLGNNRMSLIEQLCREVARLHADDLVHRDIKPSNILIKEVDGEYNLSLGDFGYCSSQTTICPTAGTPLYLPFEMIFDKDNKKHPASMDIYALCTTIIQFICYGNFHTFSRETYDHLRPFTTEQNFTAQGVKFRGYLGVDTQNASPIYRPFINVLSRGLSINASERPGAEQLADCIHELADALNNPQNTPGLAP